MIRRAFALSFALSLALSFALSGIVLAVACASSPPAEADDPAWLAQRMKKVEADAARDAQSRTAAPPRALTDRWSMTPAFDVEPPLDADGFDTSTLATRHPRGSWLPLATGGANGQPTVIVHIRGTPVVALLDTGATTSVLPTSTARRLNVPLVRDERSRDTAAQDRFRDAEDHVGGASVAVIDDLRIGRHQFADVTALVVDTDVAIIGFDVLQELDIVIATDDGVVGLFDAGQAPLFDGARTFAVRRVQSPKASLRVDVTAPLADGGHASFELLVDTGASDTALPVPAAINAGVAADVHARTSMKSVVGESEHRGRFRVPSLWLGREGVDAGPLSPIGIARELGLLGNDVYASHRTMISAARGIIALSPTSWPPGRRPGVLMAKLQRCKRTFDHEAASVCLLVAASPLPVALAPDGKPLAVDVRLFDAAGHSLLEGRAVTALLWLRDDLTHVETSLPAELDDVLQQALAHPETVRLATRVRRRAESEDCPKGSGCFSR